MSVDLADDIDFQVFMLQMETRYTKTGRQVVLHDAGQPSEDFIRALGELVFKHYTCHLWVVFFH